MPDQLLSGLKKALTIRQSSSALSSVLVIAAFSLAARTEAATDKADIRGCWERHSSNEDDAAKRGRAYFLICFESRGKILGAQIEPGGEGGDFDGSWHLIGKGLRLRTSWIGSVEIC